MTPGSVVNTRTVHIASKLQLPADYFCCSANLLRRIEVRMKIRVRYSPVLQLQLLVWDICLNLQNQTKRPNENKKKKFLVFFSADYATNSAATEALDESS
ncbi:Hypothetical predicted protein [Olea europaea subsp. europaea]|uniref:Uncharacterized protein n=1 Tax=Olea europaea subsp. europaea TaxID=158383 RepID=A0A8S0RQ32_OLEEU|nr:Hypothetical predicted protein [Olea europaea subsp. europaea]